MYRNSSEYYATAALASTDRNAIFSVAIKPPLFITFPRRVTSLALSMLTFATATRLIRQEMQFSINGNTTLVIDLFNLVDNAALTTSLSALLKRAANAINPPERDDWQVIFQLVLNGGITDIRVYYRQNSDPKRKEKWVTIHIPIPAAEQVSWGVPPQTIVTPKTTPGQEKWYRALPSILQAATLQEHCFLAAQAGIIHALTTGLTVGGSKIQTERSLLEYEV